MEIRKIQKNGDSLCVNIPSKYLSSLKLYLGNPVSLTLTVSKAIVIRKVVDNGNKADPD